jgi:hypothetical protein
LLDNHSIYNVAFALTEFRSDAFHRTVRAVRDIAWDAAVELAPETPIILTTAHGTRREWSEEWCAALVDLADRRGTQLLVVHLLCDPDENRRRIASPDRLASRKPVDPAKVNRNPQRLAMVDHGNHLMEIDVTMLSPDDAAGQIAMWVNAVGKGA